MRVPAVEWLEATLAITEDIPAGQTERPRQSSDRRFDWRLQARLYVEPAQDSRLVIPFHRCEVQAWLPGLPEQRRFSSVRLDPLIKWREEYHSEPDSHTIVSTSSEVILTGPGMISMGAELRTPPPGVWTEGANATVSIRLRASGLDQPVDALLELEPYRSMAQRPGVLEARWMLKDTVD